MIDTVRQAPTALVERAALLRQDFPILQRQVNGKPLVYLDSTATSQKPHSVLEAMQRYYEVSNANVHRGAHTLAEEATEAYEGARAKVARFLHARSPKEIVFTRNATDAINLVANSWGRANLQTGDEVLITQMEHHANIVPWQMLCAQTGATLRVLPITPAGELDLDQLPNLLTERTRLFAFAAMSNVLGSINPVAELVQAAHRAGALALVDGAQSVPHLPVDVQALGMDFLAFSAHKMCGPTGIGALYGRQSLLEAMPPFMGGGDMIKEVFLDRFIPNDIPWRFEAGTPSIAEGVGFGAAIDYLSGIGMDWVHAHEQAIVNYAMERLNNIEGLRVLGPGPERRGGVISFTLGDIHPHDLATILDSEGIAIRSGRHCAQPVHDYYGLIASARASFYLYSLPAEVDTLVAALEKATQIFAF